MGSMLAGQNVEAVWASLRHAKPLAFGMNCATGPEFMTDHIRTLSASTGEFVSCYPNAGLPDEEGKYLETPESLAAQLEKFVDHGWLNLVGGCCGTTERSTFARLRRWWKARSRGYGLRKHIERFIPAWRRLRQKKVRGRYWWASGRT